jgi:plastocyanin
VTPGLANGESVIIVYTDAGFSPSSQDVTPGTTVTWSNQSSRKLWVVEADESGADCPLSPDAQALNSCRAISPGESFSYTAPAPGSISYANQEHQDDTGVIVVGGEGTLRPDVLPQ